MGNYSEFDYGQLSIVGINGVRKNKTFERPTSPVSYVAAEDCP